MNWWIECGDSASLLTLIPDNSVDLIATDPPYFRVKEHEWDRQWSTADAFLDWLQSLLVQFRRILKPNGSLYLFASPQMSARVECRIGERFQVLNNIRWRKEALSPHRLSSRIEASPHRLTRLVCLLSERRSLARSCVAFMRRTLQQTVLDVKKNLYKTCKKATSPSLRTVRKSRTVELVRTAYRLGREIACNLSKVRLACCFLSRVGKLAPPQKRSGYSGRFAFVGSHTGHQSPGIKVPIPGPWTPSRRSML